MEENPCEKAIQGFEDVKPMVFSGIYPVDTEDYEELRYSMEKLQLNDSSLVFEPWITLPITSIVGCEEHWWGIIKAAAT